MNKIDCSAMRVIFIFNTWHICCQKKKVLFFLFCSDSHVIDPHPIFVHWRKITHLLLIIDLIFFFAVRPTGNLFIYCLKITVVDDFIWENFFKIVIHFRKFFELLIKRLEHLILESFKLGMHHFDSWLSWVQISIGNHQAFYITIERVTKSFLQLNTFGPFFYLLKNSIILTMIAFIRHFSIYLSNFIVIFFFLFP